MATATKTKVKKEPKAWCWVNGKKQEFIYPEPKRLSKTGEWMRAHPKGVGVIYDMRAVMR